ncbi:hypothetical protein CK203_096098 [Vitis vinifera]|uniref:Uncharacterized protein n=1 Tax=Vitis vinifera TaxID=29760 RepID=A0A438CN47_VITVI|nr:hypothetical protein CK203_096098 [Vitis vinifera]
MFPCGFPHNPRFFLIGTTPALPSLSSHSGCIEEATRLSTRCSFSRFLKLCNKLPDEKLEVPQVTIAHMFISMVQLHYVMKFKIPSVHVPMTVPHLSTWSDELIKQRLTTEIRGVWHF